MATVKKLNTTYTLDTTDVIITGNLTVQGTQTLVESTDTIIKDRIIVLNSGETGAGVTLESAGIEIDRGTSADVSIRWYEPYGEWQLTKNGTTFSNIAAFTGATGITAVSEDHNPALGGNLNTGSFYITSTTNNVRIGGNLELVNQTVSPSAVTGATVVYAATPGAGTSGVYVVNGSAANQELVTKARAFGFSLIL